MYRTKKARLILQSGIYNLLTNISEGTIFLLQGLTYSPEEGRPCLPKYWLKVRLYIPDCKISLAFFVLSNFSFQAVSAISNVLSGKADVNEIIRGWISEETT